MSKSKKILFIDDDPFAMRPIINGLQDAGIKVRTARTLAEAKASIINDPPDLAVIDVMFPSGEGEDTFESKAGFESGYVLGRWLLNEYPNIKFIGLSSTIDKDNWFKEHGEGFLSKNKCNKSIIVSQICDILSIKNCGRKIKTFIVHGHDDETKLMLKNYLQNTLKLSEPIILHEKPNLGRTILEKFEQESSFVDIVFVLLTPDDKEVSILDNNDKKRRSRQNVIFEMGYFLGCLGRSSKRVILLYKGKIELPSDISGLIYIDISNGIESAGEYIRREIGCIEL